jgi:hypothetical protein
VVRDSAESYLNYVEALIAAGTLDQPGHAAARSLQESIEECMAAPGERVEVPFNAGLLARCTPKDRSALVNQWSLGIGHDAAPVVVMGTEHAYDVESSPAGLAFESCASALLWLDGDGPDLAASIAQDQAWVSKTGRGYHRHPADHYRVGSGHTWRTVARVLRVELRNLGERAYQIERSAHPARASLQGLPPTPERRESLVRLLSAFRMSARVLILHGRTGASGDDWDACNRALTLAFLDGALSTSQTSCTSAGPQFAAGQRTTVLSFTRGR